MEDFSKVYSNEDDGFEGSIECYVVKTEKENLKNFLFKELGDDGNIYNIIKENTDEVLIIKNVFLEPEFRGKGYGLQMISDILTESYCKSSILVCDTHESQKPGFKLEQFYESIGFLSVTENKQNCPLMVYPEKIANNIKSSIDIVKQIKRPKI